MDLGAYVQIEDLEEILQKQCIEVPRLRGLRLMSTESPISDETISKWYYSETLDIVQRIVEQGCEHIWRGWKEGTRKDILVYQKDEHGFNQVIGYHWNKIHGKKRKWIKHRFKQLRRELSKQYLLFNSFVGKNVLYVHARIGGNNWSYFGGEKLTKHPDYLGRADDYYDSTYCDLYFKIDQSKLGPRCVQNA